MGETLIYSFYGISKKRIQRSYLVNFLVHQNCNMILSSQCNFQRSKSTLTNAIKSLTTFYLLYPKMCKSTKVWRINSFWALVSSKIASFAQNKHNTFSFFLLLPIYVYFVTISLFQMQPLFADCWWESTFGKTAKGQRGSDMRKWNKGQRAFFTCRRIRRALQWSIGLCENASIRFNRGL